MAKRLEIPGILGKILEKKKLELARDKSEIPLEKMKTLSEEVKVAGSFFDALKTPGPTGVNVIAEVKRASPSRGPINMELDPAVIAKDYLRGGASAVSVLTERDFFCGEPDFIRRVKDVVSLPVLRKDFIFDPYQVYQSRFLGADGLLLIAAMLEDDRLAKLISLSYKVGVDPLVEVHTETEMKRAVAAGAGLIGINNRNLLTFEVDLDTTVRLAPMAGPGKVLVCESGIKTRADVERVTRAGVFNFLVGERLASSGDPASALAELTGGELL